MENEHGQRLKRIEDKLDKALERAATHHEQIKGLQRVAKYATALFLASVAWLAKLHFAIASK